MTKIPRISESEWIVMQVLWDKAPQTANDIVDALEGDVAWSPRTIKTLLNRLVKKDALGYRQEGRVYHYYPKVQEDVCVHAETRSFLRRVYGGAVTPMLARFIEEENLSQAQIDELRALLEDKKRRGE